jgi:hypothetical protein
LERLESLVVERCTLTGLDPLLRAPKLRRLIISDCDIDNEGALSTLRGRKDLKLSYSSLPPDPSRLEEAILGVEERDDSDLFEADEIDALFDELRRTGEWTDDE